MGDTTCQLIAGSAGGVPIRLTTGRWERICQRQPKLAGGSGSFLRLCECRWWR